MSNFVFHNPTELIFGEGQIKKIGKAIAGKGFKKVLLIAGGGSIKNNGVWESATASLKEAGIEWAEYWGVTPNPTLTSVNEAIAKARDEKVDGLLAVGGGSVIDASKAVAAGFFMDDVWAAFEGGAITQALPLFTILTISATGSEMNCFAVVTNEKEKKKWPIGSPVLSPVATIVDPRVQAGLPWHQTVYGAVDAMAHIMEYYFLYKKQITPMSVDEALMNSIIIATDDLQKNEQNYDARASLAWAATMALNGMSSAMLPGGDWSTHLMEHAISALRPNVAHGAGLAVLFPAWITHNAKHNQPQFDRWAQKVWNAGSVEEAVEKFKEKLKQWGAPTTLGELGVKKEEIPALVENVRQTGKIGTLTDLSDQDLTKIYELAL